MYPKKVKFGFPNRIKIKSYFIYDDKTINEIQNSISLYDVIKEFVVLKKSGRDYVGRCPFCKTYTYNNSYFRVSVKLSKYKCFICGAAGSNTTSFLMRYFNKPFDEIIRYINRKYLNCSVQLNIKGIVAVKNKNNRDEDLPF